MGMLGVTGGLPGTHAIPLVQRGGTHTQPEWHLPRGCLPYARLCSTISVGRQVQRDGPAEAWIAWFNPGQTEFRPWGHDKGSFSSGVQIHE